MSNNQNGNYLGLIDYYSEQLNWIPRVFFIVPKTNMGSTIKYNISNGNKFEYFRYYIKCSEPVPLCITAIESIGGT